ncbi:MAG: hypothetical protein AAF741_19350 [Bacteroidota bacterium]
MDRDPVQRAKHKSYVLIAAVAGVLGIQVGLYELIKGTNLPMVYLTLSCGSLLAYLAFDKYRKLEDEDRAQE